MIIYGAWGISLFFKSLIDFFNWFHIWNEMNDARFLNFFFHFVESIGTLMDWFLRKTDVNIDEIFVVSFWLLFYLYIVGVGVVFVD